MRHVGIYPGTFDPVHDGHIAFALEAMRACMLDEVVFLPERSPRGKSGASDITHRVGLLRDTLPGDALRVVELASDRFTVKKTLLEIQEMFADSKLTLLIGSDVARTFLYRWQGLETLFKNVSLAIGMREGDKIEETAGIILALEKEHGIPIRHTIIHTKHAHLASSQLRNDQKALLSYSQGKTKSSNFGR